jgi:hypothetical protein
MLESQQALRDVGAGSIFWISWRSLARVLSKEHKLPREQRVLIDDMLSYMLDVLPGGVMPFRGLPDSLLHVFSAPCWRYAPRPRFAYDGIETTWRYGTSTRFAVNVPNCCWSYGELHA